jgi:hypothetical protein
MDMVIFFATFFFPDFWLLKTPMLRPVPKWLNFLIFHFSDFISPFFFWLLKNQKAVVLTLLAGWWKHGQIYLNITCRKKCETPNGSDKSGTKLILHPRSSLTTPPSSHTKAKKTYLKILKILFKNTLKYYLRYLKNIYIYNNLSGSAL